MSVYADRLARLRREILDARIDGYIIPRSDEFLGEYVPPSAERLAWISGFTGSKGFAVVMADQAAVISANLYTIQMKHQVDQTLFETDDRMDAGFYGWLKRHGIGHVTIGYDPALHSGAEIRRWSADVKERNITLRPVNGNLVDRLWSDRPAPPRTSVETFPDSFAGRSSAEKRQQLAEDMTDRSIAAAFLADPMDIAWLLNIRGRDVPFTPLALSCGILHQDGSLDWFIDPIRVPPEIQRQLGNGVRMVPADQMLGVFNGLKARAADRPILVDEDRTPQRFVALLQERGLDVKFGKDPCIIPRACKTEAEQAAIRDAHKKDAVAMTRFLAWFEHEAPKGNLDELTVMQKLMTARGMDPALRDLSFETIAGFGPNGAIVHYRATKETNRKIRGNGLLLLDSGGQYAGGTTDITRTIPVGEVTDKQRLHYTAVLKGHIAVATARFPKGTRGAQVDALARAPLWQQGMDFGHSTGHGVGCFLSVHEPGILLSPRNMEELMPGMVLSNEPGYYLEGQYGIRLESLMVITPSSVKTQTGDPFYEFETLTLVPFDPYLTNLALLTDNERDWLATYHTRILETLTPLLPTNERRWLEAVARYFC